MKLSAEQRRRAQAHGKPVAPKVKLPRGMNGLEDAYRSRLFFLACVGEIHGFTSQPPPLALADRCTYRPDFAVVMPDFSVEYHETKGFERDDAVVKFKVAAAMYPQHVFKMVKRVRDEWQVTREYRDGKPVKLAQRQAKHFAGKRK